MSAATLASLARLARAPILFEPQAATKVAAFAREQMRLPPGQKCVVVATASAAKRAAIVTHFLRRGGYLPLQCELPDGAPLESSVAQVMDAARRTGAGFLAAYGGGATLSVGKAAAALLVNEGSVSLYAPELGGRARLARPSLPFLAVPSCPSGAELHRDAHVLFQGQALATLTAHPDSRIGAVVDPALAVSLAGGGCLASGYAAFVHCTEALLRPDSDAAQRALAFEGLQRAAYTLGPALAQPRHVGHRAQLALASLIGSVLLGAGPLGACRGLALTIAGRYAVPYSAALAAVAPHALSASLDAALQRFEERGGDGDDDSDGDGDGGGGGGDGSPARQLVDEAEALQPASKHMARRLARAVREDAAAEAEEGGGDDAELRALMQPYSASPDELERLAGTGSEDEEATAALVRMTRVAGVVHAAVDRSTRAAAGAAAAPGGSGAAPPPLLPPLSIQALGGDWAHIGAAGSDPERDLHAFTGLLSGLRAVGAAHGAPPPCLDDYGLTPLDLQTLASAAEVDAHTMANVVPLRRSELLQVLQAA